MSASILLLDPNISTADGDPPTERHTAATRYFRQMEKEEQEMAILEFSVEDGCGLII